MRFRLLLIIMATGLFLMSGMLHAATKTKTFDEAEGKKGITAKEGAAKDGKDKDGKDKGGATNSGVTPLPEWATNGISVFSSVPSEILPNKKYLLYLVGDLQDMKYEDYKKIVNKFVAGGFVVIANPVQNSAYNHSYVEAITEEVRSLLRGGVVPANITVIGFSHGGIAALKISALLQNPEVNFIIVGGCPKPQTPNAFTETNEIIPVGRILNIYDKEDAEFGRFTTVFKNVKGSAPRMIQDKPIKTGKGHKFGLEPLDTWMTPAIQFAK